uniref:DUF1501 domain-containing protein n=1 Tax=Schlesneria paludicola TaxID=360056 RepID=A0A7C4QN36_9PLAN
MSHLLRPLDEVSRRSFLEYAAALLGVTVGPTGAAWANDPQNQRKNSGKKAAGTPSAAPAEHVIYLFMVGAMSHLDTFDVRGGRENEGQTRPIQTKVPGLTVGHWLPELAKLAPELAVIRNLHTATADHDGGRYLMRTSYKEIASIRHPALGAWMLRLKGLRKNRSLPDNVLVNGDNRHPGAGFLEPSYTPVPIGDPNLGLQHTKQPEYLTAGSFQTRLALIDTFDKQFRQKYPQKQVEAYSEFYRQATELMSSSDLKAFDLKQEKQEVRDKYGMDRFGQGCLLARRLVEHDVRFIEVTLDGWDMHTDIYDRLGGKAANLDRALSALLRDLKDRGLWQKTLVVLTTEFGRTPRINQNDGRDHHPGVFSSVLAGGPVRGGVVWGASDDHGQSPNDEGVTVADFNATIAAAMGLPLDQEVYSKSGRPFKVAHDGSPLRKLLG